MHTKIGKPLVIFGLGDFADIAFEYFSADSEFVVTAFTVHRDFMTSDRKFGLPIIPFEDLANEISPDGHSFFSAILYNDMNDLRLKVILEARALGFSLASYVSPKATIWKNVDIGEHCFIFEDNTIQPFVQIGFNNIIWSGNHIGHHSQIKENCFISSHVVISGSCVIENNCFIGVNSTISNNINIGPRSWIGPASLITKDLPGGSLVSEMPSKIRELDEEALRRSLQRISSRANQN